MTWGPFLPGLDPAERKARLRSLRALVKVMTGPSGADADFAILRAEISGDDPDMMAEAEATFGLLDALDRRRVLASFAGLHSPNLKVIRNAS